MAGQQTFIDDDKKTQNPKKDVPKLSPKDKKSDILDAYNELMRKYQESAEGSKERKSIIERKSEDELLERASGISLESILKKVNELEGSVRKWMSELVEALAKETQTLKEVREAVSIEKKRLEEVHQISVEAETLASLVEAFKNKKKSLEDEYGRQEEELAILIEEKQRQWKHEQEEYNYEFALKKKKENAEFEAEKTERVKEMEIREEKLVDRESELIELRQLKENFDERLKKEVEDAKKSARSEAIGEEQVKAKILNEKTLAEKHVADLTITALEKRLSEQEDTVRNLKKELEIANHGVKDIALKVIEGNASARFAEHRAIKMEEKGKRREMEEVEE